METKGQDMKQLLYGNTDKFGIFQLKETPELDRLQFEGTEALKRLGKYDDVVKPENYLLIYVGELAEFQGQTQIETLEAINDKFNNDHPDDYRGHSLSVSDMVVLHENGQNSAHYADRFGFTEIPDFMKELEGEIGQEKQVQQADQNDTEQPEGLFEDGDEIIDLGDEREQVLADMKKILESGRETELAFSIADRFISIQETEGGYDYSIMGTDYKVLEGGLYDDPNVPIRKALDDIVDDLKTAPRYNGAAGNIGENDELVQIDYDELMEKVESANRIEHTPQISETEIRENLSEEQAGRVRETLSDPAKALAEEIDRFFYDYDANEYWNTTESREEGVNSVYESITSGDVGHITEWLNAVISEGTVPEETARSQELLKKLTEYKPLAKIEEMEEQNYNMIDDMLNNGGEKAQREAVKSEHERKEAKVSLKARLAQKKAEVAGQSHDAQEKDNNKNIRREI